MSDLISRKGVFIPDITVEMFRNASLESVEDLMASGEMEDILLPSAQPEQPPYVAEIEAEYQKAVKMPHIHKPLAKALYEVWKKHDREDAERRAE